MCILMLWHMCKCLRTIHRDQFSSTKCVLLMKLRLGARQKKSPFVFYILTQEKSRTRFWEVLASGKLGIPDPWEHSLKETQNQRPLKCWARVGPS